MLHKCPIFAQTHRRRISRSENRATTTLKENPNLAAFWHIISWSVWFGKSSGDLETSIEGKFDSEGHVTRADGLDSWEGKLMQQWTSSIYQTVVFLSIIWKVFTIQWPSPTGNCCNCRFWAVFRRNWRPDDSAEMDICSWVGPGVGTELEWETMQGGIPFHEMSILTHRTMKCTYWHSGENWSNEHKQVSGNKEKLSSKWKSVDFFQHCPCRPAVGCREDLVDNGHHERQVHGSERGTRTARCDRIPICALQYVAAVPPLNFGGK